MKYAPGIVALILLLTGMALMVGDFPFEADLPDWTSHTLLAAGTVLSPFSIMMLRRGKA
jgi:hypothetical protein